MFPVDVVILQSQLSQQRLVGYSLRSPSANYVNQVHLSCFLVVKTL
uniref:Uncharacterized protein n=1 Tax=Rhizophora mucronata TaxID=61149 RepID=A0A2P2NV06_RHIMU